MARRVFELAKDLGVTSKVILEKCRAEGLDLKNHMAVLSAGLEATIREWFSEYQSATAVETTQHVDLESAREHARKTRRKTKPKEAPPEPPPAAEALPAEAQSPAKAPAEVAAAAPVEAEAQAEAPLPPQVEEAPVQPAQEAAEVKEPEAPHGKAKPRHEPPKPEKAPVKPAGPQVVPQPAKLKGPRVVRVEKPDFVQRPAPGRRPTGPRPVRPTAPAVLPVGKAPTVVAQETDEDEAAKKAKRSPRRRGGKNVPDAGQKIKEWRDQDLLERSERLAAAGGGLRRHRASVGPVRKTEGGPNVKTGRIEIEEPITVKTLSAAIGLKAADIIKKLMGLGIVVTVNQGITRDAAEAVALDYGIELVVNAAATAEGELLKSIEARPKGKLVTRAPVVTVLGHVDHGKTSLLDRIRGTTVASGEAGGITQHIGAYRYDKGNTHVVFLDTPGHEAFTAMRARGANMTDVVVLVIAADDGVMPQTVEAISHAKAAGVPIVVALNKIDLPNANIQKAMGQLAEYDLQPREWGGNTEVIQTSAANGTGVDTLLETLGLEAELLELKAEPDAPASGYVIEAKMDQGLGVLASVLVRNGTLKVGDIILAGKGYGKVRQILDYKGKVLDQAGPSTPVEIAGLSDMPEAGDKFYVADDLEQARTAAQDRIDRARAKNLTQVPGRSLESLLAQIEAGKVTELAIILKADVQGSIEALHGAIQKLGTDEVKVRLLHAAVGGISTGDVSLAEASNAIIIGFNVVPDGSAKQMAESHGVDIRLYRVIYDIVDDMRRALEEGLAPEIRQETLGRADIRHVFKISRVGTIAGCHVTDGVASRSARVRVIRNNIVIADERSLESLKRFKDDAREVRAGMECGVKVAGYDDIKEGDVLEFYQQIEVARTL